MYKINISSVDLESLVAYFGIFVFSSDFCFHGRGVRGWRGVMVMREV